MKLQSSARGAVSRVMGLSCAPDVGVRVAGRPVTWDSGDVVDVSGLPGRLRQAAFGGARASKRRWRSPCRRHDAGSVTMIIRVFFSTMWRPASRGAAAACRTGRGATVNALGNTSSLPQHTPRREIRGTRGLTPYSIEYSKCVVNGGGCRDFQL